jgi:hypothetical protein
MKKSQDESNFEIRLQIKSINFDFIHYLYDK